MNCKEFEEISGAYALDSVTPEEREAAQAHLAQCPTCTFLLKELRSAVALLALAAPPLEPPESLKARIMSAIQQEKVDITTTAAQSTPQVQTVQRTRRPRLVTQLLAAAALLLLVLFGGMSAWNISLQHQLAGTQQQLANTQQQLAKVMSREASVTIYTVKGNQSVQGATGELFYFPQRHITVLVMRGLPQLQGAHVYQGWLLRGGQPTSIGLLTVQNGVASVTFPGDITGYDAAAVSMEPGPNASKAAPAGPVIAVGKLQSTQ